MTTAQDEPTMREVLCGPNIKIRLADGRRLAINEAGQIADDGLTEDEVAQAIASATALLCSVGKDWATA